jgi:hypothetical protein
VFEYQSNVTGIELSCAAIEFHRIAQVGKELSANHELNYHVQAAFVLKCCSQVHDKWVWIIFGDGSEYLLLRKDVLDLAREAL